MDDTMNIFKPIIAGLFLFISAPACSQRQLTYEFDTTIHFHKPVTFSHLLVADKRSHKEDIGYALTGRFNRKAALVTSNGFDQALSIFSAGIFTHPANLADTLVLVLHDYRLEDNPNGDKLGTFYFRGRFYLGGNDHYKFRMAVDTLIEIKTGGDVTNAIKECSEQAVAAWLIHLGSGPGSTSDQTYSLHQAVHWEELELNKVPIYAARGSFRMGIYYTFEDFLNHTPADTPFLQVDKYVQNKYHKPGFFYKDSHGKKGDRIDSVFAIYNGQNWYQPRGAGWSRLRYEDGHFFRREEFMGIWNSSEVSSAFVSFGLVGAVVGAIVEDNTQHKRGTGIYDARLNPFTGQFNPVRRIY